MELAIEHVTKSYGALKANNDITISLEPGIYGLLGPNGAGKSTLMNILTGNISCDSGSVCLDGINVFSMGEAYRGRIGYMPQKQAMYDDFRCFDYLAYIATVKGMHKKESKKQIEMYLKRVELTDVSHKKIRALSGGMRQRLLLAATLLDQPDILLLDEPTAGLDPKQRIHVRNLISEIALEKIVIIATHVVSDVEFIANQFVLMKDGKIIKKGSLYDIQEPLKACVYEGVIQTQEIEAFAQAYDVCSMAKLQDQVLVRLLARQEITEKRFQNVHATLEDAYLYYFGT